MTIVIAIGGNSLIPDAAHATVPDQYRAVCATCRHIADLIAEGHRITITHGNGPQVGFILLRSELARHVLHEVPLDSCGADTQGAIGYHICQALRNELSRRKIRREVAAVVTQTVVDARDPAFRNPTKPIGPFYTKEQAQERMTTDGWKMMEDAGRGWRRVVPSPAPLEIVEAAIIRKLVKAGVVVVAAGGGGIPVVRRNGKLRGAAAVIDKDLGSALLARQIGAQVFLISTAVDAVYLDFGTERARPISRMTAAEARARLAEGHFAEGSMAPKIRACLEFLKGGRGRLAVITSPEKMGLGLAGKAGTRILP